ncbi:hypothetical protein [Bradyrhizobium sp. 149]|uniref:hypothetical protein n=1 Tax=Bradyrhizobium sp. 149 TaxID=2782624 RepID=UPI001FFA8E32|nr:hypothetical protein [Bradyrhizobium sp. 149]
MTNEVRLPRTTAEEGDAPKPVRPSHQKVIEQVERWANSPGLQPPRLQPSTPCESGLTLRNGRALCGRRMG